MSGAARWGWRAFDALVVAAAVLLARPGPSMHRVWAPPPSVDLVFPGGRAMANAMQAADGRITAREEALLVFRWLPDPVRVAIAEPQGGFALRLGAPATDGASLTWDGNALVLEATGAEPAEVAWSPDASRELALVHEAGRFRAEADGRPLEPTRIGPAPPGPAVAVLRAGASAASASCATASGEDRVVDGGPRAPGAWRAVWAAAVALVALAWFHAWRPRARATGAMGSRGERERSAGPAGRVAGLAVGVALVAGLPAALERHNAARMASGQPCDTDELLVPETRELVPGRPLDLGARRDGDYVLDMLVTLDQGAVLDVLLRAELPRVDRSIVVTLSADRTLPSGVSVNLGTSFETSPAPAELRTLPAGRPLRLEVACRDARTEARVDGKPLGAVTDHDLRAGQTAFHVLSGRVTVGDGALRPTGAPRTLDDALRRWEWTAAGTVLAALWLLASGARRGAAAWAWAWPAAAMAVPVAPDGLRASAIGLAALLLVLEVARGGRGGRGGAGLARRLLMLPAGAALLAAAAWALSEEPAAISPTLLNAMRPADVAGPPVPAAYAWARHPLCRRFNGFLKTQTFRDAPLPSDWDAARRVVAVGSSSTFGYGVEREQAWPACTEALLRERLPGERVRVLNAGVPGGTAERLRPFLRDVLLDLRPEVVVIDLGFNDHTYGGMVDEREHFATMTSTGIGPLAAWWRRWRDGRRSLAYNVFMQQHGLGKASDADVRRLVEAPAARFGDSLRDMAAVCREAGVAVAFVAEPIRPGDERSLLLPYRAAMEAVAAETGALLVAPQAALDALGDGTFLDVVHPRPVGHATIAAQVADALLRGPLAPR